MQRPLLLTLLILLLVACAPSPGPLPTAPVLQLTRVLTATPSPAATTEPTFTPPPTPGGIRPTANPPRPAVPDLGDGWYPLYLTLQPGDDLGLLAARYGISLDQIRAANNATSGQVFQPGQVVIVPQRAETVSPPLKLIPDSELVYSPAAANFDIAQVVRQSRGYLWQHREIVNGVERTGAEIVSDIAATYSINPRLLLAVIEYQSGWLTQRDQPTTDRLQAPLFAATGRSGLHGQLTWLASRLNHYFYLWRASQLSLILLSDGRRVALHPTLNAGTAALQAVLAELYRAESWPRTVRATGFAATYADLFGDPFTNAIEPLIPPDLTQPDLILPWSQGETWYYVGGPHPAYGAGTPWAAIDFAPPDKNVGCYTSAHPVTAAAPGVVARTDFGLVEVDLDTPTTPADGDPTTGWTLIYLHLDDSTKVGLGFRIAPGGYIGYPSCDGGLAEGAHLHLARKYNGLWVSLADVPFVLGGWQVEPGLFEYDGFLLPADSSLTTREACDCRNLALNGLTRE